MKTQLAWHNLAHNKVKTSVAILGVVFAIVLMFMQLGFLEAVKISATQIYNALDFDICLRSKDYLHLADARTFPRLRLQQAEGVPGVTHVAPLTVMRNSWRNAENGQLLSILCFGVAPSELTFRDVEIQRRASELLVRPDLVLIDTRSRRDFGPRNGRRFSQDDDGTTVELTDRTVMIAGNYTLGAGLLASGALLISESGLQQIAPIPIADRVSLGLIKVAPSQSPDEVAKRLSELLPDDVDVLTRADVLNGELNYWVYQTNYGLIFQAGVLVALIVGTAIVYQVLVSDVASLLPEYATLKAIGYGNRYLAGVILQQALALAVLGFVSGLVIAEGLYAITSAGAQIPVQMTWQNVALVFGLSIVMCTCSGLAALRKAFRADPADLF